MLTATFSLNQEPLSSSGDLRISIRKTRMIYLQEYLGVTAMHLHPIQTNKLSFRVLKCIFVGYLNSQKGNKCYHPTRKKVITSRNVTFHEHNYFLQEDQHKYGREYSISPQEIEHPPNLDDTQDSNKIPSYTNAYARRGKAHN